MAGENPIPDAALDACATLAGFTDPRERRTFKMLLAVHVEEAHRPRGEPLYSAEACATLATARQSVAEAFKTLAELEAGAERRTFSGSGGLKAAMAERAAKGLADYVEISDLLPNLAAVRDALALAEERAGARYNVQGRPEGAGSWAARFVSGLLHAAAPAGVLTSVEPKVKANKRIREIIDELDAYLPSARAGLDDVIERAKAEFRRNPPPPMPDVAPSSGWGRVVPPQKPGDE